MQRPTPDIIIYGGSFDPPHVGHMHCIEVAFKKYPAAQIFIMLSPHPAGASGIHKSVVGTFDQRWEMLKSLVGQLPSEVRKQVQLRSDEAELPAPNYTVDTLKVLTSKYVGKTFALLMGKDQLDNFSQWNSADKICEMANIVCVNRSSESERSIGETVEAQFKNLNITLELVEKNCWRSSEGFELTFIDGDKVDAASSTFRKSGDEHSKMLTNGVLEYIKKTDLYGDK